MAQQTIDCDLQLSPSDFIMRDHRVHGVSVLPGAAFLDIVYRILEQRGFDCAHTQLRDIVFTEAIATSEHVSRDIRVTLTEHGPGAWDVAARSRVVGDDDPASWHDNFTGLITVEPAGPGAPLDIALLKNAAVRRRDMAELYTQARAEQIQHGPAMRCTGTLWQGPGYLLAELDLDPGAESFDNRFYLHPAQLDAATLVAFGLTEPAGDPFIPMFIDHFRAVGRLSGRCYVHVPAPETWAPSGEVVSSDCRIYDDKGGFVAEFGKLTCKRIRSAEQVTRLVAITAPQPPALPAPPEPLPPTSAAGTTTGGYTTLLRAMIGGTLGIEAGAVDPDTGFYTLGLDSVALLRLSQEIEDRIGERLYPTLLFEFNTVATLAEHLAGAFPLLPGQAPVEQHPAGESPAPAVLTAYTPLWAEAEAEPPSTTGGDVLLFSPDDALGEGLRALLPAARQVIEVLRGPYFERLGALSYRLDPFRTEHWSNLLDGLAADGRAVSAYVQHLSPGADPLQECPEAYELTRALAVALMSRRLPGPAGLHLVYQAEDGVPLPEHAALGALARTLSAEVPALRCQAVELTEPLTPPLLQVLLDAGPRLAGEPHLRIAGGRVLLARHRRTSLPGDPPVARPGGVYLISGAAGAVAGSLISEIAAIEGVTLVLLGRRPADAGLLERIAAGRRLGAQIDYRQADVSQRAELQAVADEVLARYGHIDGVLHCAGTLHDGVFFRQSRAHIEEVLGPKVRGLRNLDAVTRDCDLDFFVAFSSLAAVVPSPGQSDYAYANAFMDHYAQWRAAQADRSGRSLSIAWPHWADGGMPLPVRAAEESRREFGLAPMPTDQGLRALWSALATGESRLVIGYGDALAIDEAVGAGPGTRPPADVSSPPPAVAAAAAPTGPSRDFPADPDIAVIGIAGRYPQAADLDEFWRNLVTGRDCVTEVPQQRWDHAALFDPEKGRAGRTYGRWGGFLDDFDRFDAAFFGISRKEAEWMDPQERLFLTTCWQTLENAGYPPPALAEETVGVFLGIMWNHYQLVAGGAGEVAPTALHSSAANRVSFAFDLHGPSIALDTACSSSLTALHLAVQSIRRGESTLALAGGVNAIVHPQKYLQLAQGRWLSEDGRCRSFGAGGTGYVPGEGVGAVLLKPLSRARADGDHIHGVIRGTRVNHAGRTSGFTVPSPIGQAELIRDSLLDSGVPPATVGYVEAHGTGTALGDPIELDGLVRGFGTEAPASCPIGSVKSNIGHLESAAGIAAVSKVLLQFRHATLAPSLHATELNPDLDFAAGPFFVQRESAAWPEPDGTPRRAVVSAFGAGGANGHLVLEEFRAPPRAAVPARERLVMISARTAAALRDQSRALLGFVEAVIAGDPETSTGVGAFLADLAYTLRVGRVPMACRAVLVAGDLAELRHGLALLAAGDPAGPAAFPGAGRDSGLDEQAGRWLAGERLDLPAGGADEGRRIPLPTYAFQEERCWLGEWDRNHRTPADDATGTPPDRAAEESAMTAQENLTAGIEADAGDPGGVGLRVLDDGVAVVVLRAPMFTDRLLSELAATFRDIDARSDVRAVVVTGTGTMFSMGATPQALEELANGRGSFTDEPVVYEALTSCRRPVIAAMQGHAAGGGFTFGLYADIVVLAENRSYSANFLKYGFTPGMGATFVLQHRLGRALADEMLLTGRSYTGAELGQRGTGVTVVAADRIMAVALDLAHSIAQHPASASGSLKAELAGPLLVQLPGVLAREVRMHEEVLGQESVDRIHARLGRPTGVPAPTPVAVAVPAPAAAAEPVTVPADAEIEAAVSLQETERAVRRAVGALLYVEPDDLASEQSFNEMGLDSVGAVEVIRDLNRQFELDLDSVAVYDHPTVPRLTALVDAAVAEKRDRYASAVAPNSATERATTRPATTAPRVTLAALARPAPRPPVPRTPGRPDDNDSSGEPAADQPGAGDIAVIGMSGRFPGADDLATFWRNLAAGESAIAEVPVERWDAAAVFDARRGAEGRTYSRWAAMLSQVDEFDPAFFHLSPLDARSMDPQQRLFLQESWKALEDAGHGATDAGERRFGVFVGCGADDYEQLLTEGGERDSSQAFLGSSPSILAARIAYFLDLTGPTLAVDTACSSSLVAVHLACESIRRGECTAALAGGVTTMVTPQLHIRTSQTGMLSPTGRCTPFDADADGIVLGEGVGVVMLRRLEDAVAAGDHIHAVIRASSMNGDGRTNGITAPSAASQAVLIRSAQARARVSPEQITYVETHGTGTPLGDPIEVKALTEVFARDGGRTGYCGLGSVKGNIGHTTMAAGIASLLKVILCLRHGQLPPTAGFHRPGADLDPVGGPFFVVDRLTDWPAGTSGRRVAAVSSFGFSGTNCHLIVGQAPPATTVVATMRAQTVVPVSGRTDEALTEVRARLAGHLSRNPGVSLRDVAYTLSVGRSHLRSRTAFVVDSVRALEQALHDADGGDAGEPPVRPEPVGPGSPDEAVLSSAGQGDLTALRLVADAYAEGRHVDWQGLYRQSPARRIPLPVYPFARDRHWPTRYPRRAVPERGRPTPAQSPDEAGPVSAGRFTPQDALAVDHVVDGRSLLPGTAALDLAVTAAERAGLPGRHLLTAVRWLRPIELSAPVQWRMPLSGSGDGWTFELHDGAGEPCARGHIGPLPPRTSDERLDLPAALLRCPDHRSTADLYAQFAAAGVSYGDSFRLVREVRFGADDAVGVLDLPADAPTRALHPAVIDAALQTVAVMLPAGRLAVPFAVDEVAVLRPLPTATATVHASREPHGFTVRIADADGRVAVRITGFTLRELRDLGGPAEPEETRDPLDTMMYASEWQLTPWPEPPVETSAGRTAVVDLGDFSQLARALVARSVAADAAIVAPGADPSGAVAGMTDCTALFVLAGASGEPAPGLLGLLSALTRSTLAHRPLRLTLVVPGDGADPADRRPEAAAAQGLFRSLAAEYPKWTVQCIDLGPGDADLSASADRILAERSRERLVAFRGSGRYVQRLVPLRLPAGASAYRDGGTYLIVGGTGGIGFLLGRHLAARHGARLMLVGRRSEDAGIRAQLAELTELGGQAVYRAADVCDSDRMRAVTAEMRSRWSRIDGVFHAALVLDDRTVANLDRATLDAVMAPKAAGVIALRQALGDDSIDFLVLFSSAVSFVDSGGQADYTAASMFEDAYGAGLHRDGHPVHVVNWGYWGGLGAVAQQRYARRLAAFGVGSVEPAEGLEALSRILAAGIPQALVLRAEPRGLALFPMAAPAEAERTDFDAARAGFRALETLAGQLTGEALRGLDGLADVGRRLPLAHLERQITDAPHHRALLRASLRMLDRVGTVSLDGETVLPRDPGEPADTARLLQLHPDMGPHVRLLEACTAALVDVLTGHRAGLEVLFPHGGLSLVEDVYRGQPIADHLNGLLAAAVARTVRSGDGTRPVRVLEIGAGTGGSSAAVLAACAATGQPMEYVYTDISAAFLRHGEQVFGDRYPFLTFRRLDIAQEPAEQDIEAGGFDVVLACNVLHATPDIGRTLRHAVSPLRADGVLLINEVTQVSDYLTVTFGLTADWWAPKDLATRLPDSPLLSAGQWRAALTAASLGEVQVEGVPGTPVEDLEQCLITARRSAAPLPAVTGYIRRVFAEVLGFRETDLDGQATFETFGVDSLVSLKIVDRFAEDLDGLPATLLFENLTIDQLAAHLSSEYGAQLAAVTAPAAAAPATVTAEPAATAPATVTAVPVATASPAATAEPRRAGENGAIAVIGVSGRYPGAPDLAQFWRNLADGVDSVTEIPADRWDWRTHFDATPGRPQRTASRWGAFLDHVELFDPAFFGILGRDAAAIDPQERLFLETVWNLLEETGNLGEHTRTARTGVFAGMMYGTYGQLGATLWRDGQLSGAHSSYWSVANRASYFFDLNGPSLAVDSACSSSLTAVHLACESLRRGECDTAIAGGVNLVLHPSHHVSLSALNMLSADGACKVFDERADGFSPGEGVGAVLLKPLERALADRDDIWAVIRGSAVNAGGKTGGYTVPNPRAQADLIRQALRRAGVDPAGVSYVEAHGTGTELGDPIELAALTRALGTAGPGGTCGIGSVKANIGHLEGAAGIAGLTKVLLQLRHRRLAPCANLENVNPKIELDGTRFFFPRTLTGWDPPPAVPAGSPGLLRAGVSSFGAGGANVHLVVEEAPSRTPVIAGPDRAEVFLLSARTPRQLRAYAERIAAFLTAEPREASLAGLSFTSQTGRRDMAVRVAVLARDVAQLAERLGALARGEAGEGLVGDSQAADAAPPVEPVAGSGDLPALAAFWAAGGRVDWRTLWPEPPYRVSYPTYPFERSAHWITGTDTAPVRLARPWQQRRELWALDDTIDLFSAHVVSGLASMPGGALVRMALDAGADVRRGTGAIVELAQVRWSRLLETSTGPDEVEVHLRRTAGSLTVRIDDGRADLPAYLEAELRSNGDRDEELPDRDEIRRRCTESRDVEGFYRSLADAGLRYGPRLRVVDTLAVGAGEYLARLDLTAATDGAGYGEAGWPVALLDGALQTLAALDDGQAQLVPVGAARIAVNRRIPRRSWVYGRELPNVAGTGPRRFDLLVTDDEGQPVCRLEGLEAAERSGTTGTRLRRPVWQPAPLTGAAGTPGRVLIIGSDPAARAAVATRIVAAGGSCRTGGPVPEGTDLVIRPGDAQAQRDLAAALAGSSELPDGVVFLAGPGDDAPGGAGASAGERLSGQLDAGLHTVLYLSAALLAAGAGRRLRVVFGHASSDARPEPALAAVHATLRSLALEHSPLRATSVFLGSEPVDRDVAATRVVDELVHEPAEEPETVTYRGDERLVSRLQPCPPPSTPPIRPTGTYLVTGGAGALGRSFAEYLTRWPVDVVMVGRRDLGEAEIARLAAGAGAGATISYRRADVTDRAAVDALVSEVRERYGPVHGVLHAAGVTDDSLAVHKTRPVVDAVVAPKVLGALHLDAATRDEPLDCFILFSSMVGRTGNLGQADYAFGNAFLDGFADVRDHRRRAGERNGRTVSIGWPLFADGGMTVDASTLRLFARRWGMVPMPLDAGAEAMRRILTLQDTRVTVSYQGSGRHAPVLDHPESAAPAPARPAADEAPAPSARAAEELPVVAARLSRLAAAFLLVDPSDVDPEADLMEQGFDSISLTELINQVNETYGLDLLPTVLFEHPSLARFAGYLVTLRAGEGESPEPRARPDAAPGGASVEGTVPATTPTAAEEPERDIAVIGMAGRLPGGDDLDGFFRRLVAGDDLVGPVPPDRADLRADPELRDVRGGFLDAIGAFDNERFNISPREAAMMDPQQRIFLETVLELFEDAGYLPADLAGGATGLFVGVATSDYDDLLTSHAVPVEAHMATGIAHSILANRISHRFDLRGPSEAVDTACSSSLVALHRAVRSLLDGECTTAVVGGVNVVLSPGLFRSFLRAGMLSPDGRCKTFDAAADGYVRAEGVGAVLLKPLRQAERDGDHIHAVIKGSAVNHSGRTPSLTAPSPDAQARVLAQAYRNARIDPRTVTYLEAHGTGTRLGDPIEVEGMKKAFDELYAEWGLASATRRQHVAVGAVKTNTGHLEAASGMAGLLKVLLCMRHGELPGNLHLDAVNPYLRLTGTPFRLLTRPESWPGVADGDRMVRRAGLSSFGFGGTNAHVVLEAPERPTAAEASVGRPTLVFPLSAPTTEGLREYAVRLIRLLEREPSQEPRLDRVAYTLQVGRTAHPVRLAVLASSQRDLVTALRAATASDPVTGLWPPVAESPEVAVAVVARAQDWITGEDVAWSDLWPVAPGRAALPAVPLTRTVHWFPIPAAGDPADAGAPAVAAPVAVLPNPGAPRRNQGQVVLSRSRRTATVGSGPAAPVLIDAAGAREEQLTRNGYNPVMLAAEEVRHDLLTDSWMELDHPAVGARMADLTRRSFAEPDLVDGAVSWLPFKHVVATSSGRAAEALLCRLWPGRRGTVLHNGLFATWLFNLADCGFRPLSLSVAGGTEPFPADVDTVALEAALAASGPVSFLCLEIGSNAGGGRPMSLRNLRAVKQVLGDDVPLVLDATRIVENAYRIIADEPGHGDSDVWNVVHDLLAVADAVTISMSKDFGIDFGGLLATGQPELSELFTADGGAAGRSVHRVGRQMLATAAGDLDTVAGLVRERMRQTATLWRRLREAGAPVGAAPGGHCVVLDVDLLPDFAALTSPVPSLLASLYRETGVRGGPHLGVPGENRVRLAVPVGMTAAECELVGDVVTGFFADPARVLDVVPLTPSGDVMRAAQGAYRLATGTPADAAPPPANPNLDMVRELVPHAVALMVPVPGGAVEIIEAGSGPTLLLMPPFNLGAGVFAHQFAAFSADHRVVAVHRPGVGRTRWDGDLGLEQVAAMHQEVLDRLEVEGRVHVVGMSFGGLQAQAFALRHPGRTASLTLIASSYRFANREGGVDRLERVAAQDLDGAIAGSGSVRLTAERDALIAALVRCESMEPRTGMRYLDVFAQHADLRDRLADIATPTLVVHGRYDSVVPLRTVHVLHGLIADSRLAEIDDAGHFACFTSPEQVNAVLAEFLDHPATS